MTLAHGEKQGPFFSFPTEQLTALVICQMKDFYLQFPYLLFLLFLLELHQRYVSKQ